ncbi:MAG: exo-alpha-sialidase [Planctomycetota bacterium]|nr:exo-alpha-sialidase [Planctomycetota bacterium]MDA1162987.1 exo-alpha-sialidase [Planctomycetota bacterium]
MSLLTVELEQRLTNLANALVDQQRARTIVPAQQPLTGFWFGGGNTIQDVDGSLHVVGRYRNHGDSRTGVAAGERGLELAVFTSRDGGDVWEKSLSFSKSDLNAGSRKVLSIEGSALRRLANGYELYVSTEKDGVGYPAGFGEYLKPGTGVWTIERLAAETIEGLKDSPIETVVECEDLRWLHVKDPFLYERAKGNLNLLFCSHPFSWSSSNTGFRASPYSGQGRISKTPSFDPAVYDFFPRGTTWDVAMTRGTCVLDVPTVGAFAELDVSLFFYDGGESLRDLDEHSTAVKRPRGYSCEELGGVAYIQNGSFEHVERLSKYLPQFISPYGTGCSRYVDVLLTDAGLMATWQQSQDDRSQPLVMHQLSHQDVAAILS